MHRAAVEPGHPPLRLGDRQTGTGPYTGARAMAFGPTVHAAGCWLRRRHRAVYPATRRLVATLHVYDSSSVDGVHALAFSPTASCWPPAKATAPCGRGTWRPAALLAAPIETGLLARSTP